ncbi:hypothetical protein [Bacillus albus]|uniref:hypothetical protein n=1 Tax=Bacillus albus TaxID=2026189 RepID=UPI0018A14A7F|nr:hypothetical protein [Bacillus albus]MBF7155706.1 hypothetical protein [Bacillus albus]
MTLKINFRNGFLDRNQGGSINAYADTLECIGSETNNVCREFYFPVTVGSKIKVTTIAKALMGSGVVALTFFDGASQAVAPVQYLTVQGATFNPYEIEASVPFNTAVRTVRISFGKFSINNDSCSLVYKNAFLEISNGDSGKYIVASGALKLSAAGEGSVSLHPNFRSVGIDSVVKYDETTIRIFLEHKFRNENRPIVSVTGSPELLAIPLAGRMNESYFDISISDGTKLIPIKKDATIFFELSY